MKQISQTKIRKAASMKQTMVMLAVALAMGIALSMMGSQHLNAQQVVPTQVKGQTAKTTGLLLEG